MNRRTLLLGLSVVAFSGCTTNDEESGIVEAIAVDEKPSEAESTPRNKIENTHLQEAIRPVCDEGKNDAQVRVTNGEIDSVKADLQELPSYSPPQGSNYEYGNYIECDGRYAVVRLLVED